MSWTATSWAAHHAAVRRAHTEPVDGLLAVNVREDVQVVDECSDDGRWLRKPLLYPLSYEGGTRVEDSGLGVPTRTWASVWVLARLESSRRLDADKGRLPEPYVDAAADDAADLADRLARG